MFLNGLLLLVAAGSVAYIAREVTTPPPPMPLRPRAATTETAPPAQTAETPTSPRDSFGIVASKNLFSPTRTETPPQPVNPATRTAVNLPKPTLHGVILREGTPIAYLEDPTTKRVAGYRLGDNVAGGTVRTINSDHVVLVRPEGLVDVRLRDPSKPRPAVAAQPGVAPQPGVAAQPGVGPQPNPLAGPGQVLPGVPGAALPGVPGAGTILPTPQPIPQPPRQPGVATPEPESPPAPPRRMLPPNVLRRVPPTTMPPNAQQ